MESESFIKKTARTTMKIVKRILLIALALGIATLAFLYYYALLKKEWSSKRTKAKSAWSRLVL
jgi:hypothetical protein